MTLGNGLFQQLYAYRRGGGANFRKQRLADSGNFVQQSPPIRCIDRAKRLRLRASSWHSSLCTLLRHDKLDWQTLMSGNMQFFSGIIGSLRE